MAVLLLGLTGCDILKSGNPTAPSNPPTAGSTIVYSAIGASDAIGHGASIECVPFTECPSGTGYVQVAVRTLTAQGFSVNLANLGIPTAVIGRDFETLGQQYNRTIIGNFIDEELPFVRKDSTVVTNYSSDGFHPNDDGYAFLASEVVAAIKSATYPAPRASCSQMSIVP